MTVLNLWKSVNYKYSGLEHEYVKKLSYVPEMSYMLKEGTIVVYVDEMTNKTYVVEAHKFFSCGLYGFSDNGILSIMFWRTFKSLIKK